MEKHRYINGEKYNIPLLIQSLDACLHGQLGYISPGQNICAFLPLDPESDMYKNFWHEPGDVLYGCSIDHPYYFHREPDGRLSLSEEEYEPDSTVWVDDHLPDILTHQFYIPVFAVDKQNNFYVIGKNAREIFVYTQHRELLAKFRLIGTLQCWYLNVDEVVCVVTSNCGSDKAKKNILRVYRLDLPE